MQFRKITIARLMTVVAISAGLLGLFRTNAALCLLLIALVSSYGLGWIGWQVGVRWPGAERWLAITIYGSMPIVVLIILPVLCRICSWNGNGYVWFLICQPLLIGCYLVNLFKSVAPTRTGLSLVDLIFSISVLPTLLISLIYFLFMLYLVFVLLSHKFGW